MIKRCLISVLFIIAANVHAFINAQVKNPRNVTYDWKTDTTQHDVELSEFMMVLPKGAFPVLNNPKFVGKAVGMQSYFKNEPIIYLKIDGKSKAYPLNVLSSHELVNDTIAGKSILVSYCPLCNSALIFNRKISFKGKDYLLDFGVSGMLRNSNMVIYDKTTESWWQQLLGRAEVGELTGAELDILPTQIISVAEFFNRFPEGQVLSTETGFEKAKKSYGFNPYVKYDKPDGLPYKHFFKKEDISDKLPAMERVVDVKSEGKYKIYPYSVIAKKGVINDTFKSKNVVLFHQAGTVSVMDEKDIRNSRDIGSVTVFSAELEGKLLVFYKKGANFKDKQTNSLWDITGFCYKGKLKGSQLVIETHSIDFAFSWLKFHPNSEIYSNK